MAQIKIGKKRIQEECPREQKTERRNETRWRGRQKSSDYTCIQFAANGSGPIPEWFERQRNDKYLPTWLPRSANSILSRLLSWMASPCKPRWSWTEKEKQGKGGKKKKRRENGMKKTRNTRMKHTRGKRGSREAETRREKIKQSAHHSSWKAKSKFTRNGPRSRDMMYRSFQILLKCDSFCSNVNFDMRLIATSCPVSLNRAALTCNN